MKVIIKLSVIAALLTGCAIHKTDFACKASNGLGCTRMSEINRMVDERDEINKIYPVAIHSNSSKFKVYYRTLNENNEPSLEVKSVELELK